MIQTKTTFQNGKIIEIFASGHAQYKPKGEDIVCAAVSTAILVTANAIEHLGLTQHTETTIKEGYFNLQVKTDNAIVDGLLKNLEYTFDELKKQYPKYMKNQKEG